MDPRSALLAEEQRKATLKREADTKARHARWIAALTVRDWERIGALADQVTPGFCPARLDDLDARGLAVGVCRVGEEGRLSGERIGALRGGSIAVLVWEKGPRG